MTASNDRSVPLCVDLDGTLITSDLLWESFVRVLKRRPLQLLAAPAWLWHGRANLKAQLAVRGEVDAEVLPYTQAFVEYLREERRGGRSLYLVTASDRRLADGVARHLQLFTDVITSDGTQNVRGREKATRLTARFGARGFDYAGNSAVDLPVWKQARRAIVVNARPTVIRRAGNCTDVGRVFEGSRSVVAAFVRALRPHQWVKNLVVLVPLITSHQISNPALVFDGLLAFVAFSLCAAAVYLMNDLLDLDADRHHPTKRTRPFAAGDLPIPVGLGAAPLLLVASMALAWRISPGFAAVLGTYLLVTTTYSWWAKQVALLDVFFLAALYTLRLIAGHEATGIAHSVWLLAFAMFVFLSLALVKRFVELDAAQRHSDVQIRGRGYAASDRDLVSTLGTSTGCLAVLVLALYVNSSAVAALYRHPMALLSICPLLLYWISRIWLMAHRGQMHDDPILFALKDRVSYAIGALALLVIWLATGN